MIQDKVTVNTLGATIGAFVQDSWSILDQAALTHTTVFVNGGQRGLQIELDPNDAALAAGAVTHVLTA